MAGCSTALAHFHSQCHPCTNKTDAENLLLETLVLVVLKACTNRDNQAWWVKELIRASSFKTCLFLFSLVSQWYRHLWAPIACNTWWQTTKYLWGSRKIHLLTKNPRHIPKDCMCYLNADSITLWCCSGDAVQSQGGQNVSFAPSQGHRFKGKAVTKQGEDRFILFLYRAECTSLSLCPQRAWNTSPLCIQCLMHGQER